MEWNKVMNFGDPSTFGTEMADRFVASGANLPPPVSDRVKYNFNGSLSLFLNKYNVVILQKKMDPQIFPAVKKLLLVLLPGRLIGNIGKFTVVGISEHQIPINAIFLY